MSPLAGVRVVDASTLFAGPLAATILGDYGADVLKIEHPAKGDPARGHGPSKDGVPLWWTMLGRNKRTLTLSFSTPKGSDILKNLVKTADVLVENFRPGTLERWGLGPETLQAINPKLIIARVTTYGQFGPYSHRPGFGTLAEAMSGFAAITGEPDGPPTLPPFGLADGIAALTCAQAIMTALYDRDVHDKPGQVIDLAIVEPMLTVLGMQAMVYDQLGTVQRRTGNRSVNNAPRNTYRTSDDRWVAVSTSAQAIAERVMHLVGRPELIDEPWFATGVGRAAHADVLDEALSTWIGERDLKTVQDAFEQAQAAIAPVYDIADVFADPQFQARDSVTTAQDPTLGPVRMPGPLYRMSRTPGQIRWTGRPRGADTDEVLAGLGYDEEQRAALRAEGVI
ncbi:crotonobetainyl-CoA:carnitine CoA-transferase CaiB-like acyl-CoA transferase [Actinoplanes lutulentus]|uniref:Crotonobetainyl-CoA:carnitine CoA-transferase CaiB-like acyl-CoA transferase n=1 Tax=Actinoplanes lutulentus TaxID=1287878 RepID=A0A327ZMQ2_9ACTN|nr:CoA transferase [Actinoplanes lutulentus]MBB2944424.1 crotonobetainyl-CoA:carnitine CoA-transferase CaiB-like acyl-CoA transferase [Actinoplanes lutulentus]RAK42344.1 crotonobetainyl-CoA:carnitine CoA-transferase CaiB-like acyl-CoA transferase [Actinoplanes lutulentus]